MQTSRLARLVPACVLIISVSVLAGCDDDSTDPPGESNGQSGQVAPGEAPDDTDPGAEASADPTDADMDPPSPAEDGDALVQKAFAGDLTIRCTFEQEGHHGVAYVTGDAHLRMEVDAPEGTMHMLKLDRESYIWGGGMPMGIKFDGEALNESFAAQFDQFTPEAFEQHAVGDNVSCEEYTGDDSVFAVPSDVTFQSMGG
ncbi:hypothetical protein [Nocardioides sp. AE5]|uniref:hypothetical protein n=1 Tax=Nocardioides sp. AE5 TaxID=2962573 RepID=UPI00288282DB|nr:hypothetical protein [Nocardioides sp. AE5]MDT0200476.1 hypothetical protein [Nocardioides sp. AE5]